MPSSRRATLLVAGWAMLMLAWLLASPPFSAPDEEAHYVRAIGLSSGHLAGQPAADAETGLPPLQQRWVAQAQRRVHVPAGLAPPADCFAHDASLSAGCLRTAPVARGPADLDTAVGTYEPLPYLLPAATLRLGDDATAALRWGRAAGALLALLLLAAAVGVIRAPAGDGRALLGPLAAVTPMALYCGASLTGSGLEVAAGVAFCCALLRLTRAEPAPARVWLLAGSAGAALALSRSASPAWDLALIGMAVALTGWRPAMRCVRRAGRPAMAAVALVLAAVALNRLWEAQYGPHVEIPLRALRLGFSRGLDQWPRAARELVVGFGYLEYRQPLWVPLTWLAAVAALLALAWRGAVARQRVVLAGSVAVAAAAPVLLFVFVLRATGFDVQGRHVLPLAVAVPLLAGELVYRRGVPVPRPMLLALGTAVAVVQMVSFWLQARRAAVGIDGPLQFLGHAEWSPPLGWPALLALAALGALAVAAAVTPAARAPALPRPPRWWSTRSRSPSGAGPTRTRAPR